MATSKVWPSTGVVNVTPTTYSIPQAGNVNWASLTDFLVALSNGAQATTFQRYATRSAVTSPVTVSTNDCIVSTELTVPAAVAVTLPAGVNKQIFYVSDGTGDANTNAITITPNGSETIGGAATLVLNSDAEAVMLAFQSSDSDWKIVGRWRPNPTGGDVGGFTINRAIVSNGFGYLAAATTTATEIGYVNGVTSSIQTQLDGKEPSFTVLPVSKGGTNSGTALNNNRVIASSGGAIIEAAAITAARALISDANGIPTQSVTTSTELSYVNGVTSAIQTQLNSKQASGNYITALTGDVTASGPGSAAATLAAITNNTLTTLSALTTASALATVGTITSGTWSATTIAVNKGGTGLTSGTSGGILGYTASGTLASSGALTASQLIIGGGAGATPSTLAAGSQYQVLVMGAANPGYGQVNLAQSAAITGTLPIANGGTAVTSLPTTAQTSAFAAWDTNKNLPANNFLAAYTTTATAGTTTTLTVASTYLQYFTGVTTQTVVLPVTSTLVLGFAFKIVNTSNSVVTVQSSGANTVQAMAANTSLIVTCILTSGTTAASWSAEYISATGAGTVTSVAMSVPTFLSVAGSPITTSGTLAVTLSGTALPIANGGTAVTSLPTTAQTSAFAAWDANKNLGANNFLSAYTTTATGASTTTLTVASTQLQYFTGVTTQTVVLPVTSTLVLGQKFEVVNNSTGNVTVQSSGANAIQVMSLGTFATFTVILTSGTTAASWNVSYSGTTAPTIQKFTSGSGTYTTPATTKWIRVVMVGGGGGGGGTGAGTTGNTAGGNTTFGTTLLVANGGAASSGGASALGGTASLGAAVGIAVDGGSSASGQGTGTNLPGGAGGVSFFGGAGFGNLAAAGRAATANSGSGGACGGTGGTTLATGGGGAAGGYVDAVITAPLGSYGYAVGSAGGAGTAGTNGFAGGAGSAGQIVVYEYY